MAIDAGGGISGHQAGNVHYSRGSFLRNKWLKTSILFLLLLLSFAGVYYQRELLEKWLSKAGVIGYLRDSGLIKINEGEFFSALESQNLVYDYNRDGAVTGEDYPSLSKTVGETSVTTDTSGSGDAEIDTGGAEVKMPSIKSFSSSAFDGSVNVNYPIDLPSGPGGLTPTLSINYSSSAVDDLQLGTHISWGASVIHSYQNQAGQLGLGWSLGGLGSISRDINDTEFDETDDKYYLSFEKGSANIVMESGDDNYSVWRTVPNLKIKVERYGKCVGDPEFPRNICRYSWVVTDPGGTKYYFGSFGLVPRSQWAFFKDPERNIVSTNYWYPLYDGNDDNPTGTRLWYTYTLRDGRREWKRVIVYKWLLSKVRSVYDKEGGADSEINYTYAFDIGMPQNNDGSSTLVKASYLQKISYGNHEVNFDYEKRYDTQTHKGDKYLPGQLISSKRLSKIVVKTLGKARSAYKLKYIYGWKPSDHSRIIFNDQAYSHRNDLDCEVEEIPPEFIGSSGSSDEPQPAVGFVVTSEAVPGVAIHSLLTEITQYSDDPDVNPAAKRLPSNKFSYGANGEGFCGGMPLTSFTTAGSTSQARMANFFFLQSAENGYGGKIVFEYYKDSSGNNALPVKYCDPDKTDGTGQVCRTDITWNTQRHRIASQTVYDGMGNFFKTQYNYLGSGSLQGLAYAEKYESKYCKFDGIAESQCQTVCRVDLARGKCACGGNQLCANNSKLKGDDLTGFEFLGYPEVEIISYHKNSTTQPATRSKTYFHQSMETPSCFKPSPLKGVASRSIKYDVQNSSRYVEEITKYKVRFGDMFSSFVEINDDRLSSYCPDYDPKNTVSLVLPVDNIRKEYVANVARLCTRSTTIYENLSGSPDPYAMPHQQIDWGKISCNNFSQIDDLSDTPKVSVMDYTQARNDTLWRVPLVKESWSTSALVSEGSSGGEKYNHTRRYYDNLPFGQLGDYGNLTKTQIIVDGSVYSETSSVFDTNYPWLSVRTTDPLGRTTEITYDNVFHKFPVAIRNPLGQVTRAEYDFNTTDTSHPNYGGVLGVVVKSYDPNGGQTTHVYDKFGRHLETYLDGRSPGSSKNNNFSKYYYFNETEFSPCNEANNCMNGLGRQLGQNGPKMLIIKGTRFDDTGITGRITMNYSFYDGLGNEVQTRDTWYDGTFTNAGISVEGEGLRDILSTKIYNAYGAVEMQSLAYTAAPYQIYNTSSNPFDTRNIAADNSVRKVTNVYDGLGRVVRVNYPGGTYERTIYDYESDPLKTKVLGKNCTDSSPQTLCLEQVSIKDAFGNVLENQAVDVQTGKVYKTRFEYHPVLGAVTKTFDTLSNLTSSIIYDKLGRKIRMWDIDMSPSMSGDENSWKYEYDLLGNLMKQSSPKNEVSEFVYDGLNRVTVSKVDGRNILENFYDSCTNGVGKLCRSISYDLTSGLPVHTVINEYDRRGRITKNTIRLSNMPDNVVNGKDFVYEYTYDEGGRLISTKLPENASLGLTPETITNAYDRNYLSSLSTSESNRNYASLARYNKDGMLLSYQTGDGVIDQFTYDPANMRLTSIVSGNGAQRFLNLSYAYEPSGNILRIIDNLVTSQNDPNSMNQNFTYDVLQRLTGVSGAYSASYRYDDIGNMLSKIEGPINVNLSYGNYQSGFYHRPQSASISGMDLNFDGIPDSDTSNYTYDAVGNLVSDNRGTYTYDANNKLVLASVDVAGAPSGTVSPTSRPSSTPTSTPIPSGIPGDANGDGRVDTMDYSIWLGNYATTQTGGREVGDFNYDGRVDGIDYTIWRNNYSQVLSSPTQTSLPSPTVTSTPRPSTTPTPLPTPTATTVVSNSLPVITTSTIQVGVAGSPYRSTVRAVDADTSDNLSMSAFNLPGGLSLQNCSQTVTSSGKEISCVISGVVNSPQTRTILIRVSDGKVTVEKYFQLSIMSI